MVRSNSGDWKMIFGTSLSTLDICQMMYGRARWQKEEDKRKDFNTVLIRQDKKFFTSERTQSHWSYTARQCANTEQCLRVHLSYWMCNQFTLHHKFRINSAEDKILARNDRRYSSQSWIPCRRATKIQECLIWPNHVLHHTSRNGKCTRIRCIGSTYSLFIGKDWSSTKQDRTQPSFTIHSQLIVSRK